jgi:mannose/fructose/N-acetylgalactosamine-specific phosphotransferase system component IIB
MEHPSKSKKFNSFSDKYKSVTKAIKALESSDPDKHLLLIIKNLKDEQKAAQEGMAKLLDSEFRAMQRELKRQV